jgi:hypothetical protein
VICDFGKAEYFCKRGWTAFREGKSLATCARHSESGGQRKPQSRFIAAREYLSSAMPKQMPVKVIELPDLEETQNQLLSSPPRSAQTRSR